MFNKIKFITILIVCFFILSSCQKTVFLEDAVFDNSLLNKISIYAENIEIKVSYQAKLDEPYIDHVMEIAPSTRIISWLENNIINFGSENNLVIDIHNASITRKLFVSEVNKSGIIKKQNEYLYELNFEVLFLLYDDDAQILATAKTEVFRSTTSSEYISLNERNIILDNLTLDSLKDLSEKSVELLKLHMSKFIL